MAKEASISINVLIDRIYRHPLLKDVSREIIIDSLVDFIRLVGVPSMFTTEEKVLTIKSYKTTLPKSCIKVLSVKDKEGKAFTPYTSTDSCSSQLKYKVQNNVLYTGIPSGEVKVEYQVIPTDDEGLPMLPDNASFLRAIEAYIKKNYFTILVDLGQLHSSVLQNAQQEYAWAVGDCSSEFKRVTFEELSAINKSIT